MTLDIRRTNAKHAPTDHAPRQRRDQHSEHHNMAQPNVHVCQATAADNTLLAEIGAETSRDTIADDNTPENMATYLAASFSPAKQAAELMDQYL